MPIEANDLSGVGPGPCSGAQGDDRNAVALSQRPARD